MTTTNLMSDMLSLVPIVRSGNYEEKQTEVLSKSKTLLELATKQASTETIHQISLLDCYIRVLTKCYRKLFWSTRLPENSNDRLFFEEYLNDLKVL